MEEIKGIDYSDELVLEMKKDFIEFQTVDLNITINDTPCTITWPKCDKECLTVLYTDWSRHLDAFNKYVKDTSGVCLMAGGAAGLYPLLYANMFERVVTFEPDALNFYCLTKNCRHPNVIKFNAALSNKPRYLGMKSVVNNIGMHQCVEDGECIFVVRSVKVDSFEFEDIKLIHFDMEGYDYKALQGAKNTIKRCRPVIFVDLTLNESKITKFLSKFGYKKVDEYGVEKTGVFIPQEKLDV
jgi:FkbM family methyltransferase